MDDQRAGSFIRSYAKYIFTLFLLIVAASILIYLTYQNVKQEMIDSLNARQMVNAKQAARGIEDFFNDHINILRNYSNNEHIIILDESGKRLMREFLSSHGAAISIITRVDGNGRILYPEPYDRKVIGQQVTNMDDFLKAKRTHQITVSDVFTNRRGYQSIIVHAPVFKNGHFNGTIALLLSFDFITKRYIQDIRIGKDGYAWIVSRNGIELSCPVPGHVGNSVFDNCREFPDILAMAKKMTKGEQGVTTYMFDRVRENTISKITKHAVFMPIRLGDTFWSIVIATPEDEVTDAMNQFRNRLLLIAIILIIAIGFILYMLIKNNIIVKEAEQRRKAEEALRASRQQLTDIIEFLPDATLAIDKERRIIIWNKAIVEMTGIPALEMIGKGDYAYTIPFYGEARPQLMDLVFDDYDEIANRYPQITREGDSLVAEVFCNALYSNKGAWVLAKASPLHDQAGNIIGVIENIRDISEQKLAEEKLSEITRRLQLATSSAKAGVWDWSLQTNEMIWDDRMLELYGLTRDNFPGGVEAWEQGLYPDDSSRAIEDCHAALNGERDFDTEFRVLRPDGTVVHIKANGIVLRNEEGEPLRMIGLNTDITDRKRAEEEKQALEERLQRAEKMEALGLLAGGVAHDLNNVIGVIVGYAELIADDIDESNPMKKGLLNIMEGGQRAAAIIQDLLTLARRGVAGRKVLNANSLILDFNKSPEWEKLHGCSPFVQLTTDLEPDLLNISASPVHLQKTLFNLVSNAAEAMPQGGNVTIKTANQYLDKPVSGYDNIREGDYVVLSIADEGDGIPEQDLRRIFEPFYTKKIMGRSGTGLGLAVVWGTVKDHQGYIDVLSEEGKGTIFNLYFPVTRDDISTETTSISLAEYMGRGESILVVDDVKGQRDLAAAMLQKLNYKVASVASGEDALEYIKKSKVDLLVLDMIMEPGMDGLDTYKQVLEIHPGQKAIIVSGFSESERVHDAQALGAGEYVKKPYVIEKLGMAAKKELKRSA